MHVSQKSQNPDITRVEFDLAYRPEYEVISPERSDRITLEFPKSPLAGKIIVIDPGHGGMDPGAIGPGGLMEKMWFLIFRLNWRNFLKKPEQGRL